MAANKKGNVCLLKNKHEIIKRLFHFSLHLKVSTNSQFFQLSQSTVKNKQHGAKLKTLRYH